MTGGITPTVGWDLLCGKPISIGPIHLTQKKLYVNQKKVNKLTEVSLHYHKT